MIDLDDQLHAYGQYLDELETVAATVPADELRHVASADRPPPRRRRLLLAVAAAAVLLLLVGGVLVTLGRDPTDMVAGSPATETGWSLVDTGDLFAPPPMTGGNPPLQSQWPPNAIRLNTVTAAAC